MEASILRTKLTQMNQSVKYQSVLSYHLFIGKWATPLFTKINFPLHIVHIIFVVCSLVFPIVR